jgi:polysaccharide deacetylase family protein (PEP-CTERM system associated)
VTTDAAFVAPLRFAHAPSVVTVDLEEWFCVCGDDYYSDVRRWGSLESRIEGNADRVLGLLGAAGRPATFFVLGWIARRHPRLVARIAAAGHEIGFHGMTHRRCDEMSAAELAAELSEGRALLEDLTGKAVAGFRAPEWSIRGVADPALEALAAAGFRYDASISAVPIVGRRGNPEYPVSVRTPSGTIAEFPPLTGRGWGQTVNFGGGWAFRRLAWSRVLGEALRYRREGAPAIFTFHPWEFDTDLPPLIGSSALLRLTRDARRRGLRRRFERLLAAGETSTLGELL